MELRIDRQALVPVVQQIVDALSRWLRSSEVLPGLQLPSVRQIAHENMLSQSSVALACDRLVAQGLLIRGQRRGFVVAVASGSQMCPVGDAMTDTRNPVPEELPLDGGGLPECWREPDDLGYAIRQVCRNDMAGLFNYSTALGLPALRQQLLKRLRRLDIRVPGDRVLTTAGASQALDLIVRTLLKPGDCVMVESPGYPALFDLLRLHGVRMIAVPRTPCGPDVGTLEGLLFEHRPRLLFINSFGHNPTGSSLTPEVARQVLQLANTHGVRVVEDDVYADLCSSPGTRLAALDDGVIYVGSYSKTLSSSLRVGFVVADADTITQLAEVKMISSMGASRFCESVLANLLANGSYRHLVQRQSLRLGNDRRATLQRLESAEWEVFGKPNAGLFIWVRPPVADGEPLGVRARRFGVSLSSSATFSPDGEVNDWLRINVAHACDPRAWAFFESTTPDRPQAF